MLAKPVWLPVVRKQEQFEKQLTYETTLRIFSFERKHTFVENDFVFWRQQLKYIRQFYASRLVPSIEMPLL